MISFTLNKARLTFVLSMFFFFFFNTCLLASCGQHSLPDAVFLKGQLLSACQKGTSAFSRLHSSATRAQSLSIHYSRHAPAPRTHALPVKLYDCYSNSATFELFICNLTKSVFFYWIRLYIGSITSSSHLQIVLFH